MRSKPTICLTNEAKKNIRRKSNWGDVIEAVYCLRHDVMPGMGNVTDGGNEDGPGGD